MAAFRFSLEQLLRYRGQLKEQAQIAYGRAKAALVNEEERAKQLDNMLAEAQHKLFALPVGQEMGERWLLEHFIKGLREDAAITAQRIRSLHAEVANAREALITRAKDHKILEKLKSKQAEHHAQEERRKEQEIFDETTSLRYKFTP